MRPYLHNLIELPAGKAVGDVLPAFSEVRDYIHVGSPNAICPGCRRPFSAVRKRRKCIRLFSADALIPIALQYSLCGACVAKHRSGGDAREALLVAIEAFVDGKEARQ
ncbi:MAG TPA: hypothetical protein VMV91_09450 [Rhodocyclaceae bacterium]|nr:hypothetical protein [Rhodocyclaceae bacterium]HUX24251.1 hypothetical protein [Burkholderiales bacterium]